MNPKESAHIRPYTDELMNLCESKLEEFRLLGYEQVKLEDIWTYVWEKLPEYTPLHQVVDFILSVRVMDFMNHQTISALKGKM